MDEKAVAIVGTGAVAQMLAYYLKLSNVSTVLCYNRAGVKKVTQTVHIGDERHVFETESEEEAEGRIPMLWLFAVKAYDLKAALNQWLIQIPKDARIVLLSNGFIESEVKGFRALFRAANIRKGVVSRGARFGADGSLRLSEKGEIKWGDALHKAAPWEMIVLRGLKDFGFAWDNEVCGARKQKWFCNTVLNTLAGAYRLPRNGDATQHPDYDALCHEVYELGLSLWPEWKGEEKALRSVLDALIRATAENENSMAVDTRLGRRTEAAFLSGLVLNVEDAARRFPHLYRLHAQLQA